MTQSGSHRAWRRVLWAATALLLAGCSAAAQGCSTIGCSSLLQVELALPTSITGRVDVEVCRAG
jgi:hypothetical protein